MKSTPASELAARREQVEQLLGNRPEAPVPAPPAPAAETAEAKQPTDAKKKLPQKAIWLIAAGSCLAVLVVLACILVPLLSSATPHSSPRALGLALESACLAGDSEALVDLLGMESVEELQTSLFVTSGILSSFAPAVDQAVGMYYIDCITGEDSLFALLYMCDNQGNAHTIYAYNEGGRWYVEKTGFVSLFVRLQRTASFPETSPTKT